MVQKFVIGLLMMTVVGAAGVGIYDAAQPPQAVQEATIAPVEAVVPATQAAAQIALPTATVSAPGGNQHGQAAGATGTTQTQQVNAAAMVGEPWSGSGTIAAFDEIGAGFTLRQADGTEVYVELGQPTFWQAQGVPLAVGDMVTIQGFDNGEQRHAATVTTAAGATLTVRTESGQPLWSGGAQGGQGAGGTGGATGEPQVTADAWVTIEGTVATLAGSALTVTAADGQTLNLQLGQARFWQAQGVTFAAGDPVEVVGFWQGAAFQPGEIRKTATGERLMLRDPNGRPLWAGPGRNGNGQAAGTQGTGTTGAGQQGTARQGTGQQGAGQQGTGQQGAGRQGGAGQQGAGQGQVAAGLPVDQWETLEGNVTAVEPLAITIQTAAGETVRVGLGQVDFWTAQGYTFVVPEAITVDGFYAANGQFEAGIVTFDNGSGTLYLRDEFGSLIYPAGNATSARGGRQYRGGRS